MASSPRDFTVFAVSLLPPLMLTYLPLVSNTYNVCSEAPAKTDTCQVIPVFGVSSIVVKTASWSVRDSAVECQALHVSNSQ